MCKSFLFAGHSLFEIQSFQYHDVLFLLFTPFSLLSLLSPLTLFSLPSLSPFTLSPPFPSSLPFSSFLASQLYHSYSFHLPSSSSYIQNFSSSLFLVTFYFISLPSLSFSSNIHISLLSSFFFLSLIVLYYTSWSSCFSPIPSLPFYLLSYSFFSSSQLFNFLFAFPISSFPFSCLPSVFCPFIFFIPFSFLSSVFLYFFSSFLFLFSSLLIVTSFVLLLFLFLFSFTTTAILFTFF